jgi:hypothetical protein
MLKTVSSTINAIGALNYAGTWNASTNVNPTLVSGQGTKGNYYVVSTAGNTNLDGETLWGVGDWAVFNGTAWQKVDGGDTSVVSSLTVTTLTGYMYGNGSNVVTASTTIPAGNVSGLGTMATQNSNNVTITGGSINVTSTNHVGTTSATANGVSSMMIAPAGYLIVDINGSNYKVPYYNT